MPTIADYAVFGEDLVSLWFTPDLNDELTGPLRVGGGKHAPSGAGSAERSYEFPLPSELSKYGSGILTFLMDTDGADGLHWEVEVNGHRARELSHDSDRFCAFQVLVPEAHFQSGMNTVTVRVLGGGGTLNVSEFAFHYQRNI